MDKYELLDYTNPSLHVHTIHDKHKPQFSVSTLHTELVKLLNKKRTNTIPSSSDVIVHSIFACIYSKYEK